MAFGLVLGVLHTGIWALAFVFPYVAEDARLRALEADKLRLEAEQLKSAAELARLRSQLEPHFLLNTLNAIAGLVTEDPREARRLLACLGDLLRDSLRDGDELQPLEDEIAWLRRYARDPRVASCGNAQLPLGDRRRCRSAPSSRDCSSSRSSRTRSSTARCVAAEAAS